MKKNKNIMLLVILMLNIVVSSSVTVHAAVTTNSSESITENSNNTKDSTVAIADESQEVIKDTSVKQSVEDVTSDVDKTEPGSFKVRDKEKMSSVEKSEKNVKVVKKNRYLTVVDSQPTIWTEKIGVEQVQVNFDLYMRTFVSKEEVTEGENLYYSLYTTASDGKENFLGYILKGSVEEADGKEGIYQVYNKYVTVLNKNYETYNNFSWSKRDSTQNLYGKTYKASGKYNHVNGSTYLSLHDENGKWYGYVNEKATQVGAGAEGTYQSYGKYVTITNKNYSTYSDFSWSKKGSSQTIYGKTLKASGKYNHFNGSTYLSLHDSSGKWYGYINENATSLGDGAQGVYQSYGKYVTIINNNYSTYSNFNWTVKNTTKNMNEKTYHAKGKYNHYSGATYLSIFDGNGKWQGYINEKATQIGLGKQGAYQAYGKYVTITNANYSTYSDFLWTKKSSTNQMYGKTYHAKGKYNHFNGLTYLSLFDSKGNWYGYVNANAVKVGDGQQGAYQSFNRHIIITSPNYDMWQNFDWKLKQKSSQYNQQGLIAKAKYTHFNGSTYYSVYDAFGNWKGYINATGTKVVSYYETPTTYYSQMAIGAWYGCAAASLYTGLRAKGYAGNVTLVNFINGLPLSDSNPDVGQIGDPWGNTPFKQVISPIGLNKYARKYTLNTEVITGSSIDRVITEINSGNIVLYWGRYLMERPDLTENPQHVMIAKGYKVVNGKEYILTQDPGLNTSTDYRAIRWFEKNDFNNYLTKKYRKMMVIR